MFDMIPTSKEVREEIESISSQSLMYITSKIKNDAEIRIAIITSDYVPELNVSVKAEKIISELESKGYSVDLKYLEYGKKELHIRW